MRGLHLEAFYGSWINASDKHDKQKRGQDLRRKAGFAANNLVQVQAGMCIEGRKSGFRLQAMSLPLRLRATRYRVNETPRARREPGATGCIGYDGEVKTG